MQLQKVTPHIISGKINLPGGKSVSINSGTVNKIENNNSIEEIIHELKSAIKYKVFEKENESSFTR